MPRWIANIISLGAIKWLCRHQSKYTGTVSFWGDRVDMKIRVRGVQIGQNEWLIISQQNELLEKKMKLGQELSKISSELDTMSKKEKQEIRDREEEDW